MNAHQFRQRFYDQLEGHALWRHPFFEVVESRPSQRLLEDWAIQAGRIDEVFADVLENMISNPDLPPEMAAPLIRNRNDELGEDSPYRDHFSYFKQLLGAIPVSLQRYRQTPMNLSTRRIIDNLQGASQGSDLVRMLGLMASEEALCPLEFRRLLSGYIRLDLRIRDLEYFRIHIEQDEEHSSDLLRLCYIAGWDHDAALERVLELQREDLDLNLQFYNELLMCL